jgi:hypothetical protein
MSSSIGRDETLGVRGNVWFLINASGLELGLWVWVCWA